MTTATAEKRAQKTTQGDYGQALAEGEITRILKTVQAAQFKKTETLAATEDTEFKARSLVEIAFAAEKKRKQAEEAVRQQQVQQQSEQADGAAPDLDPADDSSSAALDDQAGLHSMDQEVAIPKQTAQQDETAVPASDEAAKKAAQAQQQNEAAILQKRAEEDEIIRLAAEEDGYKRGFEAGLEAARKAEPTAEEVALLAEKEEQRQAIIAQFHDAIASLANAQEVDSPALEAAINKAVIELASKRAGQIISQNPEGFIKRIRGLVDNIKAAAHQVDIFINPTDLASLQNWLEDGIMESGWKLVSDKQLRSGDIRLRIGGIEVADQLNIYSELEADNTTENSGVLGNNQLEDEKLNDELENDLNDGSGEELEVGSGEELEVGSGEELEVGSGEELKDGSSEELDDGLKNEIEISPGAKNAAVPARPPYIPEAGQEFEDIDNDSFDGPENGNSNESDKE